ncbi:MAG: hypothetical protein HKN33_06290 [Pyrinomonadaceae bacterium]|nr:hypothetical protein [Pyrinomonadaceae bacterium]
MRKLFILAIICVVPIGILAQSAEPKFDLSKVSVSGSAAKPTPVGNVSVSVVRDRKARNARIVQIAETLNMKDPNGAPRMVPESIVGDAAILDYLKRKIALNPKLTQTRNFCDADFVGQSFSFRQTMPLVMDDLLYQLNRRFNVNFLVGEDIANKPINIRADDIPWNLLLKSQLFLSGVRATCVDDNTIQLVSNNKLPDLQDTAEVKTEFIKLKYLQPYSGGNVDIAGRSNRQGGGQAGGGCQGGGQGGGLGGGGGGVQNCGNFEKLIIEIEKIIGIRSPRESSIGGSSGGGITSNSTDQDTEAVRSNRSVSVVPGRNIIVVRATDEELDLIKQIISKADRAPFQVVIRGLVYTANESRLRDIGVQTTIADVGDNRTTGSFEGIPVSPLGTIFDFSTLIGTVDFNVQASALQSKGVISIKSRPFAMVVDGDTADLDVGRQIPVLIQSLNALGNTPGSLEILEAGNVLSITPQVIDDDDGKPVGVNLSIQLESNDVDTSVVSQGVPSVNRRSIQTRFLVNQETTVILGGFTVDSASKDVTKTPGLGDIPIIGYLFKRKVKRNELNRLYFAISASIVPYGEVVKPDILPGVKTDIPKVTPAVKEVEDSVTKTGN